MSLIDLLAQYNKYKQTLMLCRVVLNFFGFITMLFVSYLIYCFVLMFKYLWLSFIINNFVYLCIIFP